MRNTAGRGAVRGAMFLLTLTLAGCGLPRVGPSSSEITRASDATLPFEVVPVTDLVARATVLDEGRAFEDRFLRAPAQDVNLIGAGDSLSITVWENVTDGVLTGIGTKFTILEEVQVDQDGFIFMPYVGRIRAAGNSPESLRRIITEGLKDQTPDPQVEVRRVVTGSATVSLIGAIRTPGVYPIEAPTRRILSMLAKAGGIAIEPDVAVVTLRRGRVSGEVWMQDLYDRPEFNVALQSDDAIIVERDRRSFVALGALGSQQRVPFPSRNINALEAVGLVGGLSSQVGNPRGIFVFRVEEPAVLNQLGLANRFEEPTRTAYILDLTQPGGMFTASEFLIRNGDIIYVTEAPFVQVQKVLGAIAPFVQFAGSVNSFTR